MHGDQTSFSRLYERVAPALFAWASLRLERDRLSDIDPEDLVQEVWFRAWRGIEFFDAAVTPFRLWLFRVAKIVLLEMIRDTRASGRRIDASSETKQILFDGKYDPATAISRRVVRIEGIQALLDRIRELPELEQKLVTHCGLEGMAYDEVAPRLGMSPRTVARRWQRLRPKLAEGRLPIHLLVDV